ncbi:metallophosphoesterase family protein [Salinirubellus sp. GCM10025899]|uniref:metallophosphoesterase family protein n=1 Tax=Salinirubellus sp. GCM10025899 TaxID=3252689 RepID=UPI00360FE302
MDQVPTVTRLAVVSDVHMREAERESIEGELRATVERFEAFDPHHAFVLGDLIEDETAALDREHVEAVYGIFEDAPFPTTFLLGNHDVENLSRAALAEALGGQPRFGHVEVDGRDVLYLDSSAPRLPGARGEVGEAGLAFLRERLPAVEDALLFVHHPIGYYDIRENPWFGEFPERAFLGDRLELLELLADTSAVRATFGGHIHETRATTFRGIDHAVVNAFSKELPDVPLTGTRAEVVVGSDIEVDVYERDRRVESFVLG